MRKTKLLSLAALLIIAYGCSAPRTMTFPGTQDPASDYYVIKIDSLEINSTSNPTRVIARGIAGNNGCERFVLADTERIGYQMHVTFWGARPKQPQGCTQALVPLRHELLLPTVASNPNTGVNTIVVRQPDGTRLLRAF